MLSESCFESEFLDFLCPHFGKEITSVRLIGAYYDSFKNYSDQTFTTLCGMAFRECKFMPEPKWFSDRVAELAERSRTSANILPSAEMREIEEMTEEQLIANQRRLQKLIKNANEFPGRATSNNFPERINRGDRA